VRGSAAIFQHRLRDLLGKWGASSDLSRRSGIARSLIDKWARGESSPGLDSLDRLADSLGVPPASLISEESRERPWERVPREILDALALVHPDHYTIVVNFLRSLEPEREASELAKGFEKSRGGRNKRSKKNAN